MNSVLKILEKHRWLIACTLYLLTISIRLVGITTHPLQTDEHHWVHRSSKVLTLFKSDPLNATTHLGHPGVPAALVMAAGELAGKGWNKILGESTGDYFYLDGFSSTRIANVVFSSLITPLIFLSLSNLFGALPLLVCCLFISLGAYHIFLSRLAHIDTIQTVIVTATIIAFFYSVERQSLLLKLLAGFLWGLQSP